MVKMRFQNLLNLLFEFTQTEIITAIELSVWLLIKETDFYQMLWQTDYVKPAMALGLIAIPLISAFQEYKSKESKIKRLLNDLYR